MGGGDLNMKKHFHPLTMENLERVWKAEEKKRQEEERITQLQSELQEERRREELQRQAVESGLVKKKSEKLDWMYSGYKKDDTNDFLLGKRIEAKHIETENESSATNIPVETSSEKVYQPKASEVLLKVKEDPLFLIKKREEESRRELTMNPMKMQKMKELLEQQISKKGKKKKKKEKKKKKSKNHSSSEDERVNKNGRHEHNDVYTGRERSRSPQSRRRSRSRSPQSRRRSRSPHKRRDKAFSPPHQHRESNRDRMGEERTLRRHNQREYHRERGDSGDSKRHQERTSERKRIDTKRRHDSERDQINRRDNNQRKRHDSERDSDDKGRRRIQNNRCGQQRHDSDSGNDDLRNRQRRDRIRDDGGDRKRTNRKERERKPNSESEGDSDEEMEKKRQEMIQNAKVRNNQREDSMKQLKIDRLQEAAEKAGRKEKADFIQGMTLDSLSSSTSTVEDRIKRGIFSKQRTKFAMDKFMKR